MLFHHFGDVRIWLLGGKHEARQAAVGQVGHGADQQRHHHQWPEATHAGVDGQEQDTGADGGAEQADNPGGVLFAPTA
ncbi:hypothetical protein D3C79_520760 [compost metagenome]